MEIIYIADDGKQFDDQWECEWYEELQKHPHIYGIKFYENDLEFQIDHWKEDDDSYYNHADGVLIHNEKELADFQWLVECCGWSEFQQIDSPGMWKRTRIDLWNGKWEKMQTN